MKTLVLALALTTINILAQTPAPAPAPAPPTKSAVTAKLSPSAIVSDPDKSVAREIRVRPDSDLSKLDGSNFIWKVAGGNNGAAEEVIQTVAAECTSTSCKVTVKIGADAGENFDLHIICKDCEGKSATLVVKNKAAVEAEALKANAAAGANAAKKVTTLEKQLGDLVGLMKTHVDSTNKVAERVTVLENRPAVQITAADVQKFFDSPEGQQFVAKFRVEAAAAGARAAKDEVATIKIDVANLQVNQGKLAVWVAGVAGTEQCDKGIVSRRCYLVSQEIANVSARFAREAGNDSPELAQVEQKLARVALRSAPPAPKPPKNNAKSHPANPPVAAFGPQQ